MSLLIGRKDLWHQGYGAASAIQLLDRIFYDYPVEQAWVSVPQDNAAALRLFSRLGFSIVSDRTLCPAPDGGILQAAIMALPATEYRDRKLEPSSGPAVCFTDRDRHRTAMQRIRARGGGDGQVDEGEPCRRAAYSGPRVATGPHHRRDSSPWRRATRRYGPESSGLRSSRGNGMGP